MCELHPSQIIFAGVLLGVAIAFIMIVVYASK